MGERCARDQISQSFNQRVTLDPETSKCPRQQKRNGDRGRQTRRNRAEGRGRALGTEWRGWGWEGWRRRSRPGVPGGAGQDPDSTGKGFQVGGDSVVGEGGGGRDGNLQRAQKPEGSWRKRQMAPRAWWTARRGYC